MSNSQSESALCYRIGRGLSDWKVSCCLEQGLGQLPPHQPAMPEAWRGQGREQGLGTRLCNAPSSIGVEKQGQLADKVTLP